MNHAQMEKRCPGAKFLTAVRLDNYAFVYDSEEGWWRGPVANVLPQEGAHVWGALWDLTDEHVASLDKHENIPVSYQRYDDLVVEDAAGKKFENVIVYRRTPLVAGRPKEEYQTTILTGARECGLPADYIAKLEQA